MNDPDQFADRFGAGRDMLGYTPGATPSAEAWLETFTKDFIAHSADAAHSARALMSGLRLYTPAFVAEIAALPSVDRRMPPITSSVARAVYTATGPIILDVYERLIRRNAARADIQAAFTAAMPALLAQYQAALQTASATG